jgi:hypothetical protein
LKTSQYFVIYENVLVTTGEFGFVDLNFATKSRAMTTLEDVPSPFLSKTLTEMMVASFATPY